MARRWARRYGGGAPWRQRTVCFAAYVLPARCLLSHPPNPLPTPASLLSDLQVRRGRDKAAGAAKQMGEAETAKGRTWFGLRVSLPVWV